MKKNLRRIFVSVVAIIMMTVSLFAVSSNAAEAKIGKFANGDGIMYLDKNWIFVGDVFYAAVHENVLINLGIGMGKYTFTLQLSGTYKGYFKCTVTKAGKNSLLFDHTQFKTGVCVFIDPNGGRWIW